MKKIIVASTLALVLTGCSTGEEKKTKSIEEVMNNTDTTVSKINEKKSDSTESNNEETKNINKVENLKEQDVFNEILGNPSKYFDTEVTDIEYVIKNADTQYLLLSGRLAVEKGISQIKIFAYDKEKKTVVDTKVSISTGVASAGGFRGGLNEYTDSSNKFRYVTISSGTGDYTLEDIVLVNNGVKKENQVEGSLRNGEIPKVNVKEIAWKKIGSNVKSEEVTTTEKKEEKKKSTDKKSEEKSSSNSLTSEQSEALAKGMKSFGEKMNQVPYEKTDVPEKLTWQSGGDVSGYKIYESYIYESGSTTHRYFFVTNSSGTPEVLYSTGGTSVKHTANADIAAMFRDVHSGKGYNISSEPVNNASTNSSLTYENEYFRIEVPASWAGKWQYINQRKSGSETIYSFGQSIGEGPTAGGIGEVSVSANGKAKIHTEVSGGFFSAGAKLIPKR